MKRYILSLAALSAAAVGCQKDMIDDTFGTEGSAGVVERQIVISGDVESCATKGSLSDADSKFAYVWDAAQSFLLDVDGVTFDTADTEDGDATQGYTPTTVVAVNGGIGATFSADLSLTSGYETIAESTKIVSMGPLSGISEASGEYTATITTSFATGSVIPTDYLFIQGAATTEAEMDYTELSNVTLTHKLVPAILKFKLSIDEGYNITTVTLKASDAIFPTSVTLDGTDVSNVDGEYTDKISITNDTAADLLYALVFPTDLSTATIDVIATVDNTVDYTVGTLSSSNIDDAALNSSEAYVIPVDVTVIHETYGNLLQNYTFSSVINESAYNTNTATPCWTKINGSKNGGVLIDSGIDGNALYMYSNGSNTTYSRVYQQVTELKTNTDYYYGAQFYTSDATSLDTIAPTSESTTTTTTAQVQVRFTEATNVASDRTVMYGTEKALNSKITTLCGMFNTGDNTSIYMTTITTGSYAVFDNFYIGEEIYPYADVMWIDTPETTDYTDESENITLTASATPGNSVTWSGDKDAVATITDGGEVDFISSGSVTFTATMGDITDTITLTVAGANDPEVGDYYYANGSYSATLDETDSEAIGIIFSVDVDTKVATIMDINGPFTGDSSIWANSGYEMLNETDSKGIGTTDAAGGVANMATVMAANVDWGSSIAFEHYPLFATIHAKNSSSETYTGSIYGVWYLPVQSELTSLYSWVSSTTVSGVNSMLTAAQSDAGSFAELPTASDTATGTRFWTSSDNSGGNNTTSSGTYIYRCTYVEFRRSATTSNYQNKTGNSNSAVPMLQFQY